MLKQQPAKKVIFIEPVLAHYRHDTFSIISENENFEVYILAGTNYEGVKDTSIPNSIKKEYLSLNVFGQRFYYLRGALNTVRRFKPDVIVCSGIDFRHFHTLLIYFWSRLAKKKFVWWSHAGMGNQGKIGQWFRSTIYRNSNGILSYNSNGKNNLIHMGVPESKIQVVGNALNSEDYGFDMKIKNTTDDKVVLLYSGRITKEKKLSVLIDALSHLKQTNLDFICNIVGGGNIESYKQQVDKLEIHGYVNFLGPRYGKELKSVFAQADVFVYPGGIGLSMVQALSYGLPVITTDAMNEHGPEIELLFPGLTGDFFMDENPKELAQQILHWVGKVRSYKAEISEECKNQLVKFGYLPQRVAENIVGLLNTLV